MKLLLTACLLFSYSSFAEGDGADKEAMKKQRFETQKARVLGHITKRISAMNTFKSCISSAGSKDALKSCRQANKSRMEALKAEHKASKPNKKK